MSRIHGDRASVASSGLRLTSWPPTRPPAYRQPIPPLEGWTIGVHVGGDRSRIPTFNCVEVATNLSEIVALRDSKDPDGPILTFTPDEWDAFLRGAKAGRFDLP